MPSKPSESECEHAPDGCFDVLNEDASITYSFCLVCCEDRPPKDPQPPDPVYAKEMAEIKASLDEYLANEDTDDFDF